MKRIWLYLRTTTITAAYEALKAFASHGTAHHHLDDAAAEDLRRAQKLSQTGVTDSEIEHVSHKYDEENPL